MGAFPPISYSKVWEQVWCPPRSALCRPLPVSFPLLPPVWEAHLFGLPFPLEAFPYISAGDWLLTKSRTFRKGNLWVKGGFRGPIRDCAIPTDGIG